MGLLLGLRVGVDVDGLILGESVGYSLIGEAVGSLEGDFDGYVDK